jgi:hypothetical protein
MELALFAFATWTLYATGAVALSWTLGSAVVIHYVLSSDRIRWLIEQ